MGAAISSGFATRPNGIVAKIAARLFGSFNADDGHIRIHPARRHAIHINAIAGQFRGESLDHADQRTLGRRVIAVKSFAALSGSRTDQHDVTCSPAGLLLLLHLSNGMLDECEDAVQIDGNRVAPLRRPPSDRWVHPPPARRRDWRPEYRAVRTASPCSATSSCAVSVPERLQATAAQLSAPEFLDQLIGRRFRLLVVEQHSRARRHEHSHRSRADAARSACYQRNLAREGETHMP